MQEVRDEANAWLARFAPLVMPNPGQSLLSVEKQLDSARMLLDESRELMSRLEALDEPADLELTETVVSAVSHLPSIESDLRTRLARINGEAIPVDLQTLQQRLAEREAKQELGISTGYQSSGALELLTSPRNLVAAGGIGIFALGWNAFTLFHAVLMIGGLYRAVGFFALFLLLFYAIFFAAGFAMGKAALDSLSDERIELVGNTLKVSKTLGRWVRTKTYDLDPQSRAVVGPATFGFSSGENRKAMRGILMTDAKGKEVAFGLGSTEELKQRLARQINEYRGTPRI